MDGVTSTAAELNILDGVTSTTAELNIMDGVTSTAAELNILDGVTSTNAELNIMDGVTATTAELNYVDGVTSNVQTQINAISSSADINGGAIDGTTIGASSASTGVFTSVTASGTVQAEQLTSTDDATIADDLSVSGNITVSGASNSFATGNSGTLVTNDANGYIRTTVQNGNAQIGLFRSGSSAGGMYIGGNSNGFAIHDASFGEKLRLDQSGNLQIDGSLTVSSGGASFIGNLTASGTVTTGNLLSYGDGTNNNTFIQGRSSAGYYSGIKLARGAGNWSNASNNHFGMVVTDNGLELAKFTALGDNATGKAVYMTMADGGNTTFGGTVTAQSYSSSSDVRLKQNILSINHGLDFIMKLNPVSYMKMKVSDYFNYSSSVSKEMLFEFGLLAQDVKEISEELDFDNKIVSVKENGIHYMNYQQIMMPLIKATQEQQDIIESQQKMIEELKENLKRLETLILENK